jgi:hypothetical protein
MLYMSQYRVLTLQNDVSRWQFWAEESKTMREYVDRHSSGKTLQAIQADPHRKVKGHNLDVCTVKRALLSL